MLTMHAPTSVSAKEPFLEGKCLLILLENGRD